MSQENVEIVHRLNEAWNQGGLEQLPVFDAAPDVAERVHARMGALTDDGHTH
jgi:hypothetical protein